MGIKRTSKIPLIGKDFDFNKSIEEKLRYIGEQCIEYAINNHKFDNQTVNLEDSYGYAVYSYGNLVGSPVVRNPKATVPRQKDGKSYYGHDVTVNFLRNYKANHYGWSLLVVAGMYYASFVEFYHKLDVLQNSEMYAESLANKIFKDIAWMRIDQTYDW